MVASISESLSARIATEPSVVVRLALSAPARVEPRISLLAQAPAPAMPIPTPPKPAAAEAAIDLASIFASVNAVICKAGVMTAPTVTSSSPAVATASAMAATTSLSTLLKASETPMEIAAPTAPSAIANEAAAASATMMDVSLACTLMRSALMMVAPTPSMMALVSTAMRFSV